MLVAASFQIGILPCTSPAGQLDAVCGDTLLSAVIAVRGNNNNLHVPFYGSNCDRACQMFSLRGGTPVALEGLVSPDALVLRLVEVPSGATQREVRLKTAHGRVPRDLLLELDKLLPRQSDVPIGRELPGDCRAETAVPSPAPRAMPPWTRPRRAPAEDQEELSARLSQLLEIIQHVRYDVETLRGLTFQKPLDVRPVNDDVFDAAVAAAADRRTRDRFAGVLDLWKTFGMVPADSGLPPARPEHHVAALYDEANRRLLVRFQQPELKPYNQIEILGDVAQELARALLEDHFGPIEAARADDFDRKTALRALHEADVANTARAYRQLLEFGGFGSPIQREVAFTQNPFAEELYVEGNLGLSLVEDALKRGGFPALDALRRNPPTTTLALYRGTFFRDALQAEVPPPEAPPGTRARVRGSLGGLGVRSLLTGDPTLRLLGDAFTVVRGEDDPGVVWRALWSSPGEGVSVGQGLRRRFLCPGSVGRDDDYVVVFGDRTVLVRGFGAAGGEIALRAAAFDPVAAPAAPPPVPWPVDRQPRLSGRDEFIAPSLGVTGPLPEGSWVINTRGARDLELHDSAGHVEVRLVPKPLTPESETAFFGEVGAIEVRRNFKLVEGQTSNMSLTALGAKRSGRLFEFPRDRTRVAAAVTVPICSGRAFIGFHLAALSPGVDRTLEKWLSRLKWTDRPPPLCDQLASR